MDNVVNHLKVAAERNPERKALTLTEKGVRKTISFDELWRNVDLFSSSLSEQGFKPGDRMIVMIPMSIPLYVAMLGIIKMGGVAIFADPWVKFAQIIEFCKFAEPRGFIGIPKSHFLRLCESSLRQIPVTVSTGTRLMGFLAKHSYRKMLKYRGSTAIHRVTPDDPALITFTTGSSGIPKGANRTHGFLNAQRDALSREFPVEDSDIDMPMFPVFALSNLANGISSVIPDMDFRAVSQVDGEKLYRQIKKSKITTITASPPFFDRLTEHILFTQSFGLSLRRILTGGAPVTSFQLEKWRKAFPETEIQVVYGSTEAEPVAHISMEERQGSESHVYPKTPGYCCGKPSSLIQARIIAISKDAVELDAGDLSTIERGVGEIGELIVSGDHVCKDYYNNPAAVKENKIIDNDGLLWHRMGDTGYFDEYGYFWLTGRIHSTIFRGDDVYHPQLIEQFCLQADKRVMKAAALGIPDKDTGEKLAIVLQVIKKETNLKEHVLNRLKEIAVVADETVLTTNSFPMDPRHNSKIDYAELRRQFLRNS